MINKSDMLQDIERVLVSEEEIHARIKEVGAQIAEDYRGKCPILVGVLKGVVPFFAEMANAISAGRLHVHHLLRGRHGIHRQADVPQGHRP